MQRWIVAALLVAGCYRTAPPPAPEPVRPERPWSEAQQPSPSAYRSTHTARSARSMIAEAIAKLDEFANDMCACKDKPCADAVQSEMTRWSAELAQDHEAYDKPTDEEMEEATRVTQRLSSCMMTAMGYGSSSSPPPATP